MSRVCLAAEEGGDLEDIDGFGDGDAVDGSVDIGQYGQAGAVADGAQDAAALSQPGTAKALDGGTVGFVVTGFEDVGNAKVGGDALNGVGQHARVSL